MKLLLCALLYVCFTVKACYGSNAEHIASTARLYIGYRWWTWAGKIGDVVGPKTDKCHIFVWYVLKKAGAIAPRRGIFSLSPIGVSQWENPEDFKFCWTLCEGAPKPGDVMALNGHVGIVTGARLTTRASPEAKPRGMIVENGWGFRAGDWPVCWRYRENLSLCSFSYTS